MDVQGRQRVAMNEATFRRVNEGMETGQGPEGMLAFLCECGRLGCNKLIELTRAEYEGVRANPRRFAIVDGHQIEEVEDVVDRTERYVVVEKRGHPESEIVEYTDPRAPLDD
jgi:predicted ThiF/HesA family dinucleotide-utilizing enzyme